MPGKPLLHFVAIAALGADYRTIGSAECGNQAKNSIIICASSTLKNIVRGYTVA